MRPDTNPFLAADRNSAGQSRQSSAPLTFGGICLGFSFLAGVPVFFPGAFKSSFLVGGSSIFLEALIPELPLGGMESKRICLRLASDLQAEQREPVWSALQISRSS